MISNILVLTRLQSTGLCRQNQRYNETVEAKDFCKDEHKDHSNEQSWLLRSTTHSSITNHSNCQTSCQATQPYTQACTQMSKAPKSNKIRIIQFIQLFLAVCKHLPLAEELTIIRYNIAESEYIIPYQLISKFHLYRSSGTGHAKRNVNKQKEAMISNLLVSKSRLYKSCFSVPVNQNPIGNIEVTYSPNVSSIITVS